MKARDYTDSFRATETGFTVEEHGQRLAFENHDVFGIGVQTERNAEVCLEQIQLAVRKQGGKPLLIGLQQQSGANETNLLSNFRQSVLTDLTRHSAHEIQTGGVILGPRWAMNITSLTNKETNETVLLSELHSMGWNGDEFVVWATDEQAFLRLDRRDLNTHLLAKLLKPHVPPKQATGSNNEGLGELHAELKDLTPKSQNIIGGIVVTGVLLALSIYYLSPTTLQALVGIGVVAATTAALGFGAYFKYGKYQFLRHFEHALQIDKGDEQVTLPWEELRSLTAKWIDTYQNGVYTGTNVSMTFADENGQVIEHACSANRETDKHKQLVNLRTHASQSIATWMKRQLEEVGRVHWTSTLDVTTQGLEHAKKRMGEPELYPFQHISNWKIGNGTLKICLEGNWLASVKLESSSENFYPGLAVVESLLQRGRDVSQEAATDLSGEGSAEVTSSLSAS